MTSCRHDPTAYENVPLGMYHCPDCGVMVVSMFPHPDDDACRFQLSEWEPPEYEDQVENSDR